MIDAVLRHRDDSPALIAPAQDARLTYAELAARVDEVAERLLGMLGERRLVFLAPGPDVQAVLLYLGCLRAGLPLCLAEPQPEPLARLARAYRPALVLAPGTLGTPEGWRPVTSPVPGYVAGSGEPFAGGSPASRLVCTVR